MRYLYLVSAAMTLVGITMMALGVTFGFDAVFTLTGLMLAWAGIVKFVVVVLWHRVAGLGTDRHRPIPPL